LAADWQQIASCLKSANAVHPFSVQMRVTRGEVEFVEAVDCSQRDWRETQDGELDEPPEKTGQFIADTIHAAIKRLGGAPPVAIFMDNAASCALAGKMLEKELPETFAVGCASHHLDLLIKKIASEPTFVEVIAEAKTVVNFIRSHQWSLGAYRNVSQSNGGKNLSLLKHGEQGGVEEDCRVAGLQVAAVQVGDQVQGDTKTYSCLRHPPVSPLLFSCR
jgi:hypothetical protein